MNDKTLYLIIIVGAILIPFFVFLISKGVSLILSLCEKRITFDKNIILGKLNNSDMSISNIVEDLEITNSLFEVGKNNVR